MSLTPQEEAELPKLAEDVRIGGECVAFLQSEAVRVFFERNERALLDKTLALSRTADDERYRALEAVRVIRLLRAWMHSMAEQRVMNEQSLEALYRKQDAD